MCKQLFSGILVAFLLLVAAPLVLITCSDDKKCPVCPSASDVQWVAYDSFDDDSLDVDLWNYIEDC